MLGSQAHVPECPEIVSIHPFLTLSHPSHHPDSTPFLPSISNSTFPLSLAPALSLYLTPFPYCSLSLSGDFAMEEKSAASGLSPAAESGLVKHAIARKGIRNVILHKCWSPSRRPICRKLPCYSALLSRLNLSFSSKYNRKKGKKASKTCPCTSCSLPSMKAFLRIKTCSQTD